MTGHDLHFLWFIISYLTVAAEMLICLYACHASPYGVRCTWRGLGQQLCYRKSPPLPRAIVRKP